MQGTKTAKLKMEVAEEAREYLSDKLYVGEEIRWKGLPNATFFLIDLVYKGLMWWSVFVFIVPLGSSSVELTALLVLMLTWLEFKKQWNTRAYFVTNLRAIGMNKRRKGGWDCTDYPLSDLVSTRRTTILKSLIMKFRTINGAKTLKFPYLSDSSLAIAALSASHHETVAAPLSSDITAFPARVSSDITCGVPAEIDTAQHVGGDPGANKTS
jgi:hypothetical protein